MIKSRRVTVIKDVKPCPCCGGDDLAVGVQSAMTFGVKCYGCGLQMGQDLPYLRPRSCRTDKDVYNWTTNKAVKRWNKRVPK